jgi:Uma2 family endonuclease
MVLQATPRHLEITWEKLPDDFPLLDDPVGNIQQPFLAAALDAAGFVQPEMLLASNFALVATVNQKNVVKAPDWLFVQRVLPIAQNLVRRSYTPNLEGEPVAVVMEFLSETDGGEYSVRSTPPYGKLYFYEHILQVPTYVLFDPKNCCWRFGKFRMGSMWGKRLTRKGDFGFLKLICFWAVGRGLALASLPIIRWWDEAGNLLLWSSEQVEQERQRAEQERQRAEAAEQEIARLRAQLEGRRS